MIKSWVSIAICVLAATACVEPRLSQTEQHEEAVAGDVVPDEQCTAEPEAALAELEDAFGTGSPQHVAGINCWRQYDNDLKKCDKLLNWCLAQPPRYRPNCGQLYSDCRFTAARNFFNCIWGGGFWCRPWRWFGDHTQDW